MCIRFLTKYKMCHLSCLIFHFISKYVLTKGVTYGDYNAVYVVVIN